MRHQTELLAPAGSFDSLRAAVNAGADAVYLGGARFGARAYADNLTEEELCRGIRFAHLHGCDLYLTVNTLLKDAELESLGDYLRPYYESGLDAVIVQDLGVFRYIRQTFPDMAIHASTQMTVLGREGAALLKAEGASRVVTARELSLQEIRDIHEHVDIEIESFVHGALCYCYSGQCLLSSMLGGRSGNRGRCAQPCRLPYTLRDRERPISDPKEQYLLSPKDMCTIEILPEILEAGVCSLKIEGRMKRPEYTAGVVEIYRRYLDLYLEHKAAGKDYHVEARDYQRLQALYNRGGFSRGYYEVHNGREMISLRQPKHFDEKSPKSIREKQAYEALLAELKQSWLDKDKKEEIQGIFRISAGNPSEFVVSCREATVTAAGEPAQIPKNQPMREEQLKKQLMKTGDTPFTFTELQIQMEGEVFLPNGQLNQIRREALEKLQRKLEEAQLRRAGESCASGADETSGTDETNGTDETCGTDGTCGRGENCSTSEICSIDKNHGVDQEKEYSRKTSAEVKNVKFCGGGSEIGQLPIYVELASTELLPDVLSYPEISGVYLDSEKLNFTKLSGYAEQCHEAGKTCLLVLPAIFRQPAAAWFTEQLGPIKDSALDGVLISNLEELSFAERLLPDLPRIADHRLYAWNREARRFLKEHGVLRDTVPLELNAKELKARSLEGSELIIYGYLPLMTTANCLHRTVEGCDHRPGVRYLTDRYKKSFPVINDCRFCYNRIYNSEPLSLLDSRNTVLGLKPGALRLCLTLENRQTARQLLDSCIRVYAQGGEPSFNGSSFTRGHLKRGVL